MENITNTQELETEVVETQEESITLTQAELQSMLQAEGDKRVTSAKSRWERETSKRVSEAERLAQMSAEEKREFEFKAREEALIAKERELTLSANKVECLKIMSNKGLSAELVDFIVSEDADEMKERIALFEKVINNAVSNEVRKRIGDDTPQSDGGKKGPVTREAFKKMSLAEQMALYQSNPELYNQLAR